MAARSRSRRRARPSSSMGAVRSSTESTPSSAPSARRTSAASSADSGRSPASSPPEGQGEGQAPPTLTDSEFSAAVAAVTTAFGDPTRRDIYLFAREADQGVTAAGVADHFTLHANVARHHLDKLAAGGYLEVHIERTEGGGAGRPSTRYRAPDQGRGAEF